jgi:Flp pilus assembly protein TadD
MKIAQPNLRARGYGFGAHLRRGAIILPIALTISLGACTNGSLTTGSIAVDIEQPVNAEEIAAAPSIWGQRYAAKPKDKSTALNYAAALRRVGRTRQAVAVLQETVISFPDDRVVLASFGKALAADGQLDRALQVIRRAQTPDQPDWRLLSAEATILDQKGMNKEARGLYLQARDFAPQEPTILSNLGMSYLLTGNLDQAERALREASSMPGADSRVRQNLALAVGLQGRFAEAEAIAGAELSHEQATANVAYLRTMLDQQNSWQRLENATAGKSG